MSEFRQYVLKDMSTGKYFPAGQSRWPFVDSLGDAAVFSRRVGAFYAKHADVRRAKEEEKDAYNEIPDPENLEPQPINLREV